MPIIRRVAAVAATVLVAGLAVTAPGTANAEDGDLGIALNLPDAVPTRGDFEPDRIPWTVELTNNTDAAVTVDLRFASRVPDSDEEPTVDFVPDPDGPNHEWCGDFYPMPTIRCEGVVLEPGTTVLGLRMASVQGPEPEKPFEVTGTVTGESATATASGLVDVYNDGTDGRVAIDLPDEVPDHLVPGTEGIRVPVTVINNSDVALTDGRLLIDPDYSGEGEPTGFLADEGDCDSGVDRIGCYSVPTVRPGKRVKVTVVVHVNPDLDLGSGTIVAQVWDGDRQWGQQADSAYIVPAEDIAPTLPKTGTGLTVPLLAGAAAVLMGGTLLLTTRRRRAVQD